jgi:predicted ATP-dependent serine protease
MHDVKDVLGFLGYDELRPAGGEWRPLSEVNGRFGTTDETDILDTGHEEGLRLVNRDTGDLLATARKS